ncbi:GvpL/GvpF family gas vesicle protein [Thermomonospora cellulosilytica]|uniref:GvpL/GvpF family gas vesicle protein n=1 Tax=Thermomonospora cellulosilytica TaxID=1411118 RepID=A0A7W3R960_9ACTN|nr:GvpL/GvpF family gas vesicle protein [Thermomonospora cellulosilytica]MBA9004020.1 hypothetical protein [Thermomonospora cellulosilytica]
MSVRYIYGITGAGVELPADLRGLGDRPVEPVAHRDCAVLASELDADRPIGTREDLLAHERVLERLARDEVTVLPFRFGAVLPDRDSVLGELLEPNHDEFAAELAQLEGMVQLTLKGKYVEETVLGEVMRERPEIVERREALKTVPEDAAYYDRIQLGEMIAQSLEDKARGDAEYALDRLARHAERTIAHPPRRSEEILDAAFLVRRDRRAEFDRAVDELGQEWNGRVRLRLLGPLPPYDFTGHAEERGG